MQKLGGPSSLGRRLSSHLVLQVNLDGVVQRQPADGIRQQRVGTGAQQQRHGICGPTAEFLPCSQTGRLGDSAGASS